LLDGRRSEVRISWHGRTLIFRFPPLYPCPPTNQVIPPKRLRRQPPQVESTAGFLSPSSTFILLSHSLFSRRPSHSLLSHHRQHHHRLLYSYIEVNSLRESFQLNRIRNYKSSGYSRPRRASSSFAIPWPSATFQSLIVAHRASPSPLIIRLILPVFTFLDLSK